MGFEPTHHCWSNDLANRPLQPLGYSSIRWRKERDLNPRLLAESLVFKTSSINQARTSFQIKNGGDTRNWTENQSFADLCLTHLAMSPCYLYYNIYYTIKKVKVNSKTKKYFLTFLVLYSVPYKAQDSHQQLLEKNFQMWQYFLTQMKPEILFLLFYNRKLYLLYYILFLMHSPYR